MKILGIDTTTKFLCLGVYDGARIYEYNLEVGRLLSSLINLTIKRVTEALGWQINEIDYFACGLGPGSFTGIRVGLAAMKGLAWSLKKPLIGIPTLDVLASNVSPTDKPIVTAVDAKRALIYCSVYRNKTGFLKKVTPYMLLSQDDFLNKIKSNSLILGDALNLYRSSILEHARGAVILDNGYWYPRAHNIISLALEKIRAKKINNSFNIKPIYLYPKECQIRKT